MSTSKREMYRKQCKQLKIFDKRPNAQLGFKLSLLSDYSAIRCVRFVKRRENILQNAFFLPSLLAKTNTQKHPICPYFQPFIFYFYAIFERITCIQHHFTFLVGRLFANFRCPKMGFQQSKYRFMQHFYPLITSFFHQSQTNNPTYNVHHYTFRLAFCYILCCVQRHFTLRFAAFYLAFSGIQHCVLLLNAMLFAPNRTTFAANCPPSCIIIAFMQCLSSFHHLQTNPIFHQNKPPRESIICGRVDDWLIKTVLIMLNTELKTLHGFVLI